MRKYELFCQLKVGFDIENTDQIIDNIAKALEGMGGKLLETNKMGRRRLAYEIAGNRDSFCASFIFELAPDKLTELKRYLKLNENVLRNFITHAIATPARTAVVNNK